MKTIHLLVWKVILRLLRHSYPKKFGFISLRITQENHSNNMVIATFLIKSFHSFGLSAAHMIQPTMIRMKHTTSINDTIIWANAHVIVGNALVASSFASSHIQSHIIGKHVFSLTQLHVQPQVAAFTYVHHNPQKPNNTANIHPNRYDNILFLIVWKQKYKISTYSIIQSFKKIKKNQTFLYILPSTKFSF